MSYRRYAVYYAVWHLVTAAFAVGFLLLDAFDMFDRFFIYCPFHFFLHLYCPACGGTRAVWLLLSGDIVGSLIYNPTAAALLLALVYYEVAAIRSFVTKRLDYIRSVRFFPLYTVVGICLLYCIVRNLLLVFGIYDGIGELLPYWK